MRKLHDLAITLMAAGALIIVLIVLLPYVNQCRPAYGSGNLFAITLACRELQPAMTEERATKLAAIFLQAGEETQIDPLLLVAISFRESSLSEQVENREVLGKRGEIGLMQNHGVSLRFRPAECTKNLEVIETVENEARPGKRAYCQIHTGARWLQYVYTRCSGSHWRWVAAYGMSKCPSEQVGGMDLSTRRARKYYLKIGGREWL